MTLGHGFFLPGMIVSSYLILVWLGCRCAELLVRRIRNSAAMMITPQRTPDLLDPVLGPTQIDD